MLSLQKNCESLHGVFARPASDTLEASLSGSTSTCKIPTLDGYFLVSYVSSTEMSEINLLAEDKMDSLSLLTNTRSRESTWVSHAPPYVLEQNQKYQNKDKDEG